MAYNVPPKAPNLVTWVPVHDDWMRTMISIVVVKKKGLVEASLWLAVFGEPIPTPVREKAPETPLFADVQEPRRS
jgi:hypothetical protein